MTRLTVDLLNAEAMGLAQLCKRFTFDDAERFANRHDGGRERDAIIEGIRAPAAGPRRSGARPAMTSGRPSSGGRLFFTVRHAIHSAMHPHQRNTTHRCQVPVLERMTMVQASDSDTTTADNVRPIRPFEEEEAIAWLRAQPGGRTKLSDAELARRWGWNRKRVGRRIKAWGKSGRVTRRGDVRP
jgi:hypothetical protein